MASGMKVHNSFTNDPGTEKGKSEGIFDEKVEHGQTIKSAFPQDNVHGLDISDERGGKVGGSVHNLSHSLEGASAVQGTPKGNKSPYIPNH